MKKICFLLLVPCLLNPITQPVLASDNSIVISDEVVSTFKNSFKGNIELSTDLKFLYDSYLPPITIVDQFDDNNRINVIKYNNTFYDFYYKKISEGKCHRVALSHVCKKLIRVIYCLEKNNIDFDPSLLK